MEETFLVSRLIRKIRIGTTYNAQFDSWPIRNNASVKFKMLVQTETQCRKKFLPKKMTSQILFQLEHIAQFQRSVK